jgi:hypothetical protein
MTALSKSLAAVVALPMLLVFGTALALAVGERSGVTVLGGVKARNAAEAAGLGHSGEVLRFLRLGDDPRTVYPVNPDIISSSVQRATPLEAAIWSRRVSMIRMLDREGMLGAADVRRDLACLALDLRVEDIVEYLAPEGASWCTPDAAADAVIARTLEGNP